MKLGRIHAPDLRDAGYPMSAALPALESAPTSRYWEDDEYWGDQHDTPHCVGYSWCHWLEDGPILHVEDREHPPVVLPTEVYNLAQLLDEWEGEDYDGTSVRAGVKALQEWGYVEEYRWALDAQTVADAVLAVGPVVVGTLWTEGMFFPDPEGRIHIYGQAVGGHAYLLNGYDTETRLFRVKNSWGRHWGQSGYAFLHLDDLQALLLEDGEACLALEQRVVRPPDPEPPVIIEPETEPVTDDLGILGDFVNWLIGLIRRVFRG